MSDLVYPTRDLGLRRFRMFASIFLVYLGYAIVDLDGDPVWKQALGGVLIAGFVALYLGPLPHALFMCRNDLKLPVLMGMVAITAVYLLAVGPGGLVFSTYLSISIIVGLPSVIAVPTVLALVTALTLLPSHVASWGIEGQPWSISAPTLLVAFAMLAVRRSQESNDLLYQARQEVEQLAAEQERMRIARDLHDLLGHSLTTVTVKAELAARLVERDPAKAKREMEEVAALTRQGLADVRAALAGYRDVSLVTELATASEVLRAAGIAAELPASTELVPAELRELFGWAVREGVTNAVRHSRAQHLRVEVGDRAIEVVDDGHGAPAGTSGSGLRGLTERAAAIGGRVTAGPAAPQGFRLRVEGPA